MALRTEAGARPEVDVAGVVAAVERAVGDLIALIDAPDPEAGPRVPRTLTRFGPAAAVGFLATAWAEAGADPARRIRIVSALTAFAHGRSGAGIGAAGAGRGPAPGDPVDGQARAGRGGTRAGADARGDGSGTTASEVSGRRRWAVPGPGAGTPGRPLSARGVVIEQTGLIGGSASHSKGVGPVTAGVIRRDGAAGPAGARALGDHLETRVQVLDPADAELTLDNAGRAGWSSEARWPRGVRAHPRRHRLESPRAAGDLEVINVRPDLQAQAEGPVPRARSPRMWVDRRPSLEGWGARRGEPGPRSPLPQRPGASGASGAAA